MCGFGDLFGLHLEFKLEATNFNISRHKSSEKARYAEIAYGSLMEVLNILIVAVDLNFIPEISLSGVRPLFEEISNKLNRLRESQLRQV